MRLYLIRHGRQNSRLCNVDVDLSEEGYRQAALLGGRLSRAQIEVLYSSDLKRALETAQTANSFWNVEHIVRPELREISFGALEGLSDAQIGEQYGSFQAEKGRMEADLPYPGGECAADVVKRALPAILKIADSGVSCAAVVTHGELIRCVTACILGMDLAKYRLMAGTMENCSITELLYDPEKKRFFLERFNDYAHLEPYPELLRSGWKE